MRETAASALVRCRLRQLLIDEVVLMGLRVVGCLMLAACCLCVVRSVVAQEARISAEAAGTDESGALMPPEVAFATDEPDAEAETTALVPPEVALATGLGGVGVDASGVDGAANSDAASLDARGFYDRYRRFNTLNGPTGGFHLSDPSNGMPGSFRIQLATDFFSSSDYLHKGDEVDVTRHALSLSWTATETIELFGTLSSRASSYEIDAELASGSNQTQSLQATGDLSFGMKLGTHVSGPLFLGGDARVLLNSGEGKAAPELAATGLTLRASAAVDLRRQTDPIPFIARLNVGYSIDNSAELVGDREAARYDQVTDARPLADETRHLANRFERLAFGLNRVDTLGLGLGIELPLFVANDFYLHPLVEWAWGVPVNRQAYDCPHLALTDVGSAGDFEDSCLDDEGLAAAPMTLSLGLRVVTPLRGFSAFAGVDIGLTGTSTFVRELAPTAPYAVLLGVAVDYDARPAPVQIIERQVRVESTVQAPVTGRVVGTIVDQSLGTAVALATVELVGSSLSALRTGDDGRFVSFELPPGEVRFAVTHPDYERAECVTAIAAAGGDVEARCAVTALPRKGALTLRVTDVWGAPIPGASVQLNGPVVMTLNGGSDGVVQSEGVAVGQYSVRVDAPNHYLRVAKIDLAARQTTQLALTLTPRTAPSRAELRGSEVRLSGTVRFARGSAEIDAALAPVIADLADLLLRNPQVAHVRIEGPADAGGDAMLGLSRALAIKQRLVDAGVESNRINAIAGQAKLRVVAE